MKGNSHGTGEGVGAGVVRFRAAPCCLICPWPVGNAAAATAAAVAAAADACRREGNDTNEKSSGV